VAGGGGGGGGGGRGGKRERARDASTLTSIPPQRIRAHTCFLVTQIFKFFTFLHLFLSNIKYFPTHFENFLLFYSEKTHKMFVVKML